MSWTKKQSATYGGSSSETTSSKAFASNVTSGNLIVVCCDNANGVATASTNPCTDTLGTSYSKAVSNVVASTVYAAVYYGIAPSTGANTPKITWASGASFPNLVIFEFSGNASSSPLDKTSSATGTLAGSGSLSSGTTATLSNSADLAIGYIADSGTISAGESGWTSAILSPSGNDACYEYDALASTTGVAATATDGSTTSNSYVALVATFLPSSGGGNAALSSTVSAKATVTGTFTDIRPLSGAISAKGSLTGAFTDILHLSSTISGKATVTGTFTDILHLSGTASGKGSLAGAFTDILHLSSTISAKGSLTGTLTSSGGISFNGTISAKATVTGNLKITAVQFITPGGSHGSANIVGVLTLVSPPPNGPPVVALVSILPLPAIFSPVPTQPTLLPQNPMLTNQVTSGLVGCSIFPLSPEVVLLTPTSPAISNQTPVNTTVGVLSVNPPVGTVIPDSPVVVVVSLI